VLVGDTACVPLVARAPLQPPLAVQLVALVLVQVSVLPWPAPMDVGFATRLTVGGAGVAVTVTVTESPALPPSPLQASAYVVVPAGDTVCVPLVDRAPLQPPLAVQAVALALVHVSVLDWPEPMDVGLAVRVTVGGGATVTVAESPTVPPAPVQTSA
jgi:hypothetical protein